MKIGISINTGPDQSVWSAGLCQNVYFLAQALQAVPFVKQVFMLSAGGDGQLPREVDAQTLGLTVLPLADAADMLDVVIEMAGAVDPTYLARLRAKGIRVVYHAVNQPYAGLAEPQVFGKENFVGAADRCDRVWVLPKDTSHAPMLRTIHRCAVDIAPYLWSPYFLDRRISELKPHGLSYAWDAPASAGWRVAVMEPNISVVKNCVIPMLICDQAYRMDKSAVAQMLVLNTTSMSSHPTMLHLANSLDIVKAHKASFDGRVDTGSFLATHADAVVSHQWCNDQNYLYFDALYGDYPLIHNSPWLKDAGYYYPNFEAAEGAKQLLRARKTHRENLGSYRKSSQAFISKVAPRTAENVHGYGRLLTALWDGRLPERLRA